MKLQTNYLQVPTEEQREYARKSVNSTAESVQRDVQHLREWLVKQFQLPNYKDEDVLAHMLLHCGNSLEKAKRCIQKGFTARGTYPEIFSDRNPYEKCFEAQKNLSMCVPLRKLTPDGYRIAMFCFSEDSKDIPPADIFIKMNFMSSDLGAKLDYNRGMIVIIDGAHLTMPMMAALTAQLQKFVFLTERVMPNSYAKIYFFNMGRAADIALALAKSILKKKVAQRIEILKNPTDLSELFPKDIIPREYGGDELPLEQLRDLWFEDIKMNYDYLKYVEQFTPDFTKLPKDYAATELSGMEGSFRQISVD